MAVTGDEQRTSPFPLTTSLHKPCYNANQNKPYPLEQVLQRIQQRFVLGGHKAAAIAHVAQRARIMLVSPALAGLRLVGLEHWASAQAALDAALAATGPVAPVIVLPQGSSTLPSASPPAEP